MLAPRPTDVFSLPRCGDCGTFHFYPKPVCPKCGGAKLDWAAASGGGCVYSFSVVHRAPSAAFKEQLPYVIAIVKTDEGPHLLSRVEGIAPEAVAIGLRLRARMQDGRPVFEPEKVTA